MNEGSRPSRWPVYATIALSVVTVVLLGTVLFGWFERFLVFGTFSKAVAGIAHASGKDPNLIKGLLVIMMIPFFWAVRDIGGLRILTGIGRMPPAVAWGTVFLYVGGYFLTLHFARATFAPTGESLVWLTETPAGTLELCDTPGVHPTYGTECKPATPELVELMRRQTAGSLPQEIHLVSSINERPFFDPITGKAKVWFYRTSDERIELYDQPGKHPTWGKELQPVTPDVVGQVEKQLRADQAVREQQKQVEAKAKEQELAHQREAEARQREEQARQAAAADQAERKRQQDELRGRASLDRLSSGVHGPEPAGGPAPRTRTRYLAGEALAGEIGEGKSNGRLTITIENASVLSAAVAEDQGFADTHAHGVAAALGMRLQRNSLDPQYTYLSLRLSIEDASARGGQDGYVPRPRGPTVELDSDDFSLLYERIRQDAVGCRRSQSESYRGRDRGDGAAGSLTEKYWLLFRLPETRAPLRLVFRHAGLGSSLEFALGEEPGSRGTAAFAENGSATVDTPAAPPQVFNVTHDHGLGLAELLREPPPRPGMTPVRHACDGSLRLEAGGFRFDTERSGDDRNDHVRYTAGQIRKVDLKGDRVVVTTSDGKWTFRAMPEELAAIAVALRAPPRVEARR